MTRKKEAVKTVKREVAKASAGVYTIRVIHGYHGGTIIKKLVRDEFNHPRILKKINLDAGRTIFQLKN